MSDSQRPEDHDAQDVGSIPPPPPPPPAPPMNETAVMPPLPPAETEVIAPAPYVAQPVPPQFAQAPQPERAAKKPKKEKKPKAPKAPKGAPAADGEKPKRKKGAGWLIGGGITVLALAIVGVGGWFGYNWLNDTKFSPVRAAEAYYDKVTSGDVDGALKIWAPEDDDDAELLATAGAFELARDGEAEVDFEDPSTYGHRSTIDATFTVGGLEYRQEISLRYSEREWLIFPKWQVEEIESSYTADALVSEYLQHLIDGRATAAVNMLSDDISGDMTLINDEIYLAAEQRPESYKIEKTAVEGTSATVRASYTIGDKEYDGLEFKLETEGKPDDEYGVWTLESAPLDYATLWNVAAVTSVNGVTVDLSSSSCDDCGADVLLNSVYYHGGDNAALVLPGSYVFAAPESTGAVTYGEDQTLTVVPEAVSVSPAQYDLAWTESRFGYEDDYTVEQLKSVVSFDGRLGDDAQKKAVDQVWAQINLCMESDQFVPKNCPNTLEFRDPSFYAVTDIARSWEEKPEVRYDQASNSVIVADGLMKVDYTWRYFEDDPWEPDSDTVYAPFDYFDLYLPVLVDADGNVSVDLSQL